MRHQYRPLSLLCLMFLTVGAMFTMNDILLPAVMELFALSYTQATMIQVSFYITYVLFPIPVAWLIHRFGYKSALLVALVTCAVGCMLFYPASVLHSYPVVLVAVFTISTGITVINVAANPLITLLGSPEGSHIRINFVQSFSRIGYAVTPVVATFLIYGAATGELRVYLPYLFLAGIILTVGLLIYLSDMPALRGAQEDVFSVTRILRQSRRLPHLLFGVIAMFFYVGAEASTAGFFIPYLTTEVGLSVGEASRYLTLYYTFAAVMGIVAAVWILRFVKASTLVGTFGLGMIGAYIVCIFFDTGYNQYVLASLGLFLSIMFPTLFSLAIEQVGAFAARGSALLNFAIVGGAVFAPLQGLVADNFSVSTSYIVPLVCFAVITCYAFLFTKGSVIDRKLTGRVRVPTAIEDPEGVGV